MAAVALRMPSSYVPVEAEEMEYLEGGKMYVDRTVSLSTSVAYSALDALGSYLELAGVGAAIAFSVIGAGIGTLCGGGLVGTIVGGAIGAVGGLLAGSVLWGWASAFNTAAIAVYNLKKSGVSSCKIRIQLNNSTLSLGVSK